MRIMAGHQAQLWHPGILTKDLLALALADQLGGVATHLVVDQDVHPTLALDVPIKADHGIAVKTLTLASTLRHVPTGFQPPVNSRDMLAALDEFCHRHRLAPGITLNHLRVAIQHVICSEYTTLATQVAAINDAIRRQMVGVEITSRLTSELSQTSAVGDLVAAMLDDPLRAAGTYNRAASAFADAGIEPMLIAREWVELPLWACRWNKPRAPVFADIASSRAMLIHKDGQPIDRDQWQIMPRALTMTLACRRSETDLFVHGLGGGQYDRITEQWANDWLGETIAPMATATADVVLDLGINTATKADLAHAIWYAHHLPHNLHRHPAWSDHPLSMEKRQLLAQINTSRDRRKKRAMFQRIHQINDTLTALASDAIAQASEQLQATRQAIEHRALLSRRDWACVLYPDDDLKRLRQRVQQSLRKPDANAAPTRGQDSC